MTQTWLSFFSKTMTIYSVTRPGEQKQAFARFESLSVFWRSKSARKKSHQCATSSHVIFRSSEFSIFRSARRSSRAPRWTKNRELCSRDLSTVHYHYWYQLTARRWTRDGSESSARSRKLFPSKIHYCGDQLRVSARTLLRDAARCFELVNFMKISPPARRGDATTNEINRTDDAESVRTPLFLNWNLILSLLRAIKVVRREK